jgi:hypothetical protein
MADLNNNKLIDPNPDPQQINFFQHLLKPRSIEETQEIYSYWAEKYDEVIETFKLLY